LKNPSHKRAGGVAQGEGPEFKPQYCKKKKKKRKKKKPQNKQQQQQNQDWRCDSNGDAPNKYKALSSNPVLPKPNKSKTNQTK
jgi:hypothetical protein